MTNTPEVIRIVEPWAPRPLGRGGENSKAQSRTGPMLSFLADEPGAPSGLPEAGS